MTTAPNFQALISYWRNNLADKDRLGELPSTDNKGTVRSSLQGLWDGWIEEERRGQLFRAYEQEEGEEAPAALSVLVYLGVLQKEVEHGQRSRGIASAPLVVPACLTRKGQLYPKDELPLVPRPLLEPHDTVDYPIIGKVTDYDEFCTREEPPGEGAEWGDLRAKVDGLWRAVVGESFQGVESLDKFDGFFLQDDGLVTLDSQSMGPPTSLRGLYDTLREADDAAESAPLLADLAQLERTEPQGPQDLPSEEVHLAQMSGEFPLAPSQRRSLLAQQALGDGQNLTINGPPGTGKTTLLQSVIASEMARRALEGGEPPLLLVASNNNQAVTNVLDAMAGAGRPPEDHPYADSPLARRWLPGLDSYGLYLPSQSQAKAAAAKGHPYTTHLGFMNDVLADWEKEESVQEAADYVLARYAEWAGAKAGQGSRREQVETVREALRQELGGFRKRLKDFFAAWRELEAVRSRQDYATQADLQQRREELATAVQQAEQARDEAAQRVSSAEQQRDDFRRQEDRVWEAVEPSWMEVLLPGAKRRWRRRVVRELADTGIATEWTPVSRFRRKDVDELLDGWARLRRTELDQALTARREESAAREAEAVQSQEELAVQDEEIEARRVVEGAWREQVRAVGAPEAKADEPAWDDVNGRGIQWELDRLVRYPAFLVAARYWEVDWVATLLRAQEEGRNLKGRGKEPSRERLRRIARLTPCLVSTFYTLPRQMSYYRDGQEWPLWGEADWLIVDEAGQVSPEVGATGFALARRGLVVGDQHQIEPIRELPEGVDRGNLTKVGLAEYESFMEDTGRRAWSGNLITVAQSRTRYGEPEAPDPGMFLAEHRRCLDPIIEISNQMVYKGKLIPCRGTQAGSSPFAPLGYAHIHTHELSRAGTSPYNPVEARALAQWVADHRQELLDAYPNAEGNLAKVLAIVTPFKAQAGAVRRALRDAGVPEASSITVGTVHALQGAESPVVLFSTTYPGSHPGTPFFDQGPNMLNVAVSRAKDSFLVFGDMRLLDPEGHKPSSYLARALFRGEFSEEIPDLDFTAMARVEDQQAGEVELNQLASLEDHRRALAEAFSEARRTLLIVSPWVAENALNADAILDRIRKATQAGVRVTVVASSDFQQGRSGFAPDADPALYSLQEAGAEVRVLRRVHSKVVASDDKVLLVGSFNWLSAVRDQQSNYSSVEHSMHYRGQQAPDMIERLWGDFAEAQKVAVKGGSAVSASVQ